MITPNKEKIYQMVTENVSNGCSIQICQSYYGKWRRKKCTIPKIEVVIDHWAHIRVNQYT